MIDDDATYYRHHAAWCAYASTIERDPALAGTVAALAWLAAERACELEADALEREKAAWCQP